MIELEEARERILRGIAELPAERISIQEACGRIAAEKILSPIDLPGFDNSAMDGYAVRAGDVARATRDNPISLRLAGRAPAGQTFAGELRPGECLRVFTGSLLPAGADAVVMQEETQEKRAGAESTVAVFEAVKPSENVRLRGSELAAGALLLAKGMRITAGRAGLLAAVGLGEVEVGRRPRVAILATGDELREASQPVRPGELYESNRVLLSMLARGVGAEISIWPLVQDTLSAVRVALAKALEDHDVVVTSGGVSVGEFDFVKQAFEAEGGTLEFWRVAIKPGKPLAFGTRGGKLFFGLPGNPVSACVTSYLLVRPALVRLQGASGLEERTSWALLSEEISNRGDRRHWMRVAVDAEGNARSAGLQASHGIAALAAADGLLDVPPRTKWPAGRLVRVLMLE